MYGFPNVMYIVTNSDTNMYKEQKYNKNILKV